MSPTPPARLWLVRHAQPLVAAGTCYGALDVPADAAATQAAARRLAQALPKRVIAHHSTLQRCELLALATQALRHDLTIHPDARLREMDFGTWEGRAWDRIGQNAIDAWTADFALHRPGGGDNLAALLARVAAALNEARQQARGGSDVVWFTHAGVARCVAWLLAHGEGRIPRADEWPVPAPAWGEWAMHDLS
ncbi:histidine phosphatase family protein [Acidovorax sp. JG5]|uniref:histidine phosphatase family protein n=1 Tax=Acidovorax sp. JG5 TaxID=2822718 RepID=UPI001B33D76C|nr:histidine phosphatase family protein [Acidovorax sp. JG5]MBP3979889.1 histidine phosphatase family protein [Acidovorax sp. JG5]